MSLTFHRIILKTINFIMQLLSKDIIIQYNNQDFRDQDNLKMYKRNIYK